MELLLAFALTLLAAVLISDLADRTVLSTAVLFLVVGFLLGNSVFGIVPERPTDPLVEILAELALFAVLFTDGMRVGIRDLSSAWRLPGRALFFGLPLTMGLTALIAHTLTSLSWAECRRHSAQDRLVRVWAIRAVSPIVNGSPKKRARPGSLQAEERSRIPTRMPSVKSTANSASSARVSTRGSVGRSGTMPKTLLPSKKPTTKKSTAVLSTVRSARSEMSTAARRVRAKARRSSMVTDDPPQPRSEKRAVISSPCSSDHAAGSPAPPVDTCPRWSRQAQTAPPVPRALWAQSVPSARPAHPTQRDRPRPQWPRSS